VGVIADVRVFDVARTVAAVSLPYLRPLPIGPADCAVILEAR
jgi:hypothetical protein